MVSDPKPTRSQGDLAEMLEMLLDKGVVVNADVAVSIGDTELLGIELRAAVASFETAAEYGLEFPTGTDMSRVKNAANVDDNSEIGIDTGATAEAKMSAEHSDRSNNSSAKPDAADSVTVSESEENAMESSRRERGGGDGEHDSDSNPERE